VNQRGNYGSSANRRGTTVGSILVQTLELKQRYDKVKTGSVQAVLNELSRGGTLKQLSATRWESARRDGAWVTLTWYPDWEALEVTISDRELRPVDEIPATRKRYEGILEHLTPVLQMRGATVVGRSFSQAPRAAVGLTLYHSVEDRANAVRQMAIDWDAVYQNLATQAGEIVIDRTSPSGYRTATQADLAGHPVDTSKLIWWKSFAKPLIQQWTTFKQQQLGTDSTSGGNYLGFAERFETNWDVYENWKSKLDSLRDQALKLGFKISAPAAPDLPRTLWGDVEHFVEDKGKQLFGAGEDALKFVKYAAYAALGIGAIVALSSVGSNLRSGRDPAANYLDAIGSRRTPRALPRRQQLALAAGDDA
jgi:hypothetical protein